MQVFRWAFLALMWLTPQMALAEEASAPSLKIELNTAQPVDGGCQLSFVLRNELPADIEQLTVETVLFSSDGGVLLLTLFDFGDLPRGRPRVRQFAVPNLECSGVGMVLVNGAETCAGEGLTPALCETALSLSSRAAITLDG